MRTRHTITQGTYFVDSEGGAYKIWKFGQVYPTFIVGEVQSGYWWAGRTAPITEYQRELIALHTAA